jgi:tRNA-2-methylthio-N6-dimethylallyladenosine synthase
VKKYWLESYGCQMNMAESNAISESLEKKGFVKADTAEEADVAIINTCAVRESAEERIWGRLGYFAHVKKGNKHLRLIVTGCMAQHMLDTMRKEAPQVDYVVPVNDKQKIVDIACGLGWNHDETYRFDACSYQEGDITSFVPIMNGCDNFCSYCIVPYVRGREVSRSEEEILKEVDFLESKGVREIVLLGQNVNSYAYKGITFPKLLQDVVSHCHKIEWIRFESPHPKDFSDDLISVIKNEEKVAKHLHIPLQSGSSRILSLMNRHYDKEQFLALIRKIRKEIPAITFAVDVMVGFPGETEEDYQETLAVLDEMRATEPFMYYYNEREGTRAVKMEGKLDEKAKTDRLADLIVHQNAIVKEEKEKRIGRKEKILITQVSKKDSGEMLGHSEHDEMVVVPTDTLVGSFVTVRLDALRGNTFVGSVSEEVRNG